MKPAKIELNDLDETSYETLIQLLDSDERVTDVNVVSNEDIKLSYTGACFDNARLAGDFMNEAGLPKLQALDVVWDGCSLVATNFESATIERADFRGCRMDGVQCMEADIQKVRFFECRLVLGNFRNAILKNVVFEDSDLSEADFYGATLENVWFENCDLQRANFTGITGKQIDLRSSNCRNIGGLASLSGAVISSQQLMELAPELAAALKIQVNDD